ncbi:MAG: CPBP family intramembrane metalloprotease [Negativicutes bacterium]|nr:CPBP family intramembrane metalloprotease [Negativicutes bacterium]
MLPAKVPWTLRDVLSIHVLRLVVGLLLVRVIYPLLFDASAYLIEVTDRLVVIGLVWAAVRKHRSGFAELGLSARRLLKNISWGLAGGIVLLTVSMYSERLYTSMLLLTPSQHPLIAAVGKAASWRDLAVPLFLAGLAAPVAEEVLYRMFTFLPLKDRYGIIGGALISAGVFALFHFNPYWLPEMLVVGIGLAVLYYKTGSLVSSIVAHSFINTSKIIMLFIGLPLL